MLKIDRTSTHPVTLYMTTNRTGAEHTVYLDIPTADGVPAPTQNVLAQAPLGTTPTKLFALTMNTLWPLIQGDTVESESTLRQRILGDLADQLANECHQSGLRTGRSMWKDELVEALVDECPFPVDPMNIDSDEVFQAIIGMVETELDDSVESPLFQALNPERDFEVTVRVMATIGLTVRAHHLAEARLKADDAAEQIELEGTLDREKLSVDVDKCEVSYVEGE